MVNIYHKNIKIQAQPLLISASYLHHKGAFLFDRYRFCQVSRLVDIGTFVYRDEVGEQL